LTLERIDMPLEGRRDFVTETTLSGVQPTNLMRDAKALGYQVDFVFVALDVRNEALTAWPGAF
jgi:predicted ABC-type ATPase